MTYQFNPNIESSNDQETRLSSRVKGGLRPGLG